MSGLRLENVKTVFEGGGMIGPVSLTVPDGQMMALLGASGSGKTTTLRMIAGLAPLLEGEVFFGGMKVAEKPVRARRVGMVFQNFGLFPHLTVQNNISFGLRMKRTKKNLIEQKLDWILEKTRLKGLEHRFPHELSGGQRQRVALAQTLVMDPDVLLLDEPLSNLDANLREEMALFIKNLQRDLQITTLFVTHDQDEALMLADQVAVMADGQLLQQGTPENVFERPMNREVAEFMGAANLLNGRVEATGLLSSGLGVLPLPQSGQYEKGDLVTFMIRPEHIRLQHQGDEKNSDFCSLSGEVRSARYHGGSIVYSVKVAEELLVIRQDSQQKFEVGCRVDLFFNSNHLWPLPEVL